MSLSLFAPRTVMCWCLAVASPALVFAEDSTLTPQYSEYSIAGPLPGDQNFAQASINPSGGFVVWQDNSVSKLGLRIRAERLSDSSLMIPGTPFTVSSAAGSKTAGDQEKPQVALLPTGAVIVWQGGKPGAQQIYARFYNASGVPINKTDLKVASHTKNNQSNPVVAALTDGSVVIVWSSDGQDGSMQGVFAKRFSADGKPAGDEFQVNVYTLNNQRTPSVAALSGGNFVVSWISELQRNPGSVDAYGRIFSNAGIPVTGEILLTAVTNHVCANPVVAGSSQGGFALAWSQSDRLIVATGTIAPGNNSLGVQVSGAALASTTKSTDSWDIYGRVFDANGAATTEPFRVNSYTYGDQFGPRISASGANYMVVWTSLSQTNGPGQVDPWEGVYAQLLSGDGSLQLEQDLHVNTTVVGRQLQPMVTSDNADRFLVLWSSIATTPGAIGYFTFDIFAQQYLRAGGQ